MVPTRLSISTTNENKLGIPRRRIQLDRDEHARTNHKTGVSFSAHCHSITQLKLSTNKLADSLTDVVSNSYRNELFQPLKMIIQKNSFITHIYKRNKRFYSEYFCIQIKLGFKK